MKNKKLIIILGGILAVIIALVVGVVIFYNSGIKPVGGSGNAIFEVKPGENKIQIVKNLKKEGLIKNEYATLIYVFTHPGKNLQAGSYDISKDMDATEIINKIADGKIINPEVIVKVTFIEGKRFNDYAKVISENFDIEYDDIIKKCSDKEFLQTVIDNYWFVSDEILSDKLYYPLEGYIFPDTYQFYEKATIEEIIYTMLNEMEKKLEPYKDKIQKSKFSAHELLTMASIIDKEAIDDESRKGVSQVIYKRLELEMNLGMDVTTYYGVKKDMKEDLYDADLQDDNPYNTRNPKLIGLPAGPICSPSLYSIDAVFNPSDTDYVYFIADVKTGKVYFANTYEEFLEYKDLYM